MSKSTGYAAIPSFFDRRFVPRKLLDARTVPTLVQERVRVWGRCIHTQRLSQRLTAAALAERAGLSEATLRRLERGDAGAAASAYLGALSVLGVLETAAPALPHELFSESGSRRVRLRAAERVESDDEYF